MRHVCFQLARHHQAAFIQLYISCPLALALSRNAARAHPDKVPERLLMRMDTLLEAPEPGRHAWEANNIVIAADSAPHTSR